MDTDGGSARHGGAFSGKGPTKVDRSGAYMAYCVAKNVELLNQHFDLHPAAIIRDLDSRRPIFKPMVAYGHFGRHDIDASWEKMDKTEVLRSEAGL